jgi:Flp pilus assembly protein TadD
VSSLGAFDPLRLTTGYFRRVAPPLGACGLAAFVVACTPYGARPVLPKAGGAPWNEITSPHFRVLSDLPPDDAEATARELERGLAALTEVAFEHARIASEPTTVVVFRNRSEFRAFLPELYDGEFTQKLPNDLERSPFLLIHDKLGTKTRVDFLHEMTHDLFTRNFGWSPPWLAEGWAQYYSTVRVLPNGDEILGEAPPGFTFTHENDFYVGHDETGEVRIAIPISEVPRPSVLMAIDHAAFYESMQVTNPGLAERNREVALYAGSWALVHMLLDGGELYTSRFQKFLEHAKTRKLDEAWRQSFADIPTARLDADFRRYLEERRLAVWTIPSRAAHEPPTITRKPLDDAAVHLLWARLSRWGNSTDLTAKQDLDAALAEAPDSPEPRYWLALYAMAHDDPKTAEQRLQEALALAPKEPRVLLAMVALRVRFQSSFNESELVPWIDRLRDVATTAGQLVVVAGLEQHRGNGARGLQLAERAVAQAPTDPWVLTAYGMLLFENRQVDRALAVQRLAIAYLPDQVHEPKFYELLKKYEAARGELDPK